MSREVKGERSVVVVSDLDPEADEKEIAETFEKYGRLQRVLVAKQRPWVALVYFDDKREARESARCLDGTRMSGSRVTVELASGTTIRSKGESSKVYMYDLGNGATKREICEIFKVFGRLKHVWAENQRDEYVVIVYEKTHQAKDAVRNLDGTLINGKPVRVKLASERDTRVSQGNSEEVYVGNLGSAIEVREIEDTFTPFGALRRVWVSRNPEGCALVWFKDERDAREAVWCLDRKTFKVSYGFDCIYTKSYKDDQLHANSMKSTFADDKPTNSKTSRGILSASIDSIDDWDGNKVNEKVPDEGCVRNEDRVHREGSALKRKSVEIEDDKTHLHLEATSKFNQLAQLLEYRPRDVGDDGVAGEMITQSSDVTRTVICANGGSVDKKAKLKLIFTTGESAEDKKKKLEKKKRKKSKNESHSPGGRSESSTPSYVYKSVDSDYKVNNNTSNNKNTSNNNKNICNNNDNTSNNNNTNNNKTSNNNNTSNNNTSNNNTSNNNNNTSNSNNSDSYNGINTCEPVELPALENESAQTESNVDNVNNNGNTENNSINNCDSNINNCDNNINNCDSNINNCDNNINNCDNNINKCDNNINNCDNTHETVEFPAPENSPQVVVEIVPRPVEETPNSPPDEERFSNEISDVEMRNAAVVAAVNDSQDDDDAMAMTSMPLTSSPSSSEDPSTTTGLPLMRVDQRSESGINAGICPQPSTIYIIHHYHHHHHYHHYHCHQRDRLAGDGELVATTESDQ